jgi:dTDP-4-amino-4,6-dideoxygalactose transaminase
LVRTPKAPELLKLAAEQGIYLGDWYTTPIAPVGVQYEKIGYTLGSCPVAEQAATESLNLPTDINTTQAAAERVVAFMKSNL